MGLRHGQGLAIGWQCGDGGALDSVGHSLVWHLSLVAAPDLPLVATPGRDGRAPCYACLPEGPMRGGGGSLQQWRAAAAQLCLAGWAAGAGDKRLQLRNLMPPTYQTCAEPVVAPCAACRVFPLEEVALAHEHVEGKHTRGKVGILIKEM